MTRLGGELRQDFWYALRLIGRNPGFSAVAILTLAVAIGGNTAVFSLINAIAIKPLPVRAPQEIARVYSGESQMSWPNYQDLRQRTTAFTDLAAHGAAMRALTDVDPPVRVMGEIASSNYLTLLGVPPLLGRTFTSNDRRPDLVVLSERTWQTRYASDASIVGRTITLDRRRYEVIGVMAAGFRGVRPPGLIPEFWIPVDDSPANRALQDRDKTGFEIIGRLAPERTAETAQAEMRTLATQLKAEHPTLADDFASGMEVFPVDTIVGGFRGMANTLAPMFMFTALMTLLTGFVLLVGCANIAGLLLGRATARRHEVAIRLALGASRGRLIRQLLAESLLLALIGGAGGILLSLILGAGINRGLTRLPFTLELDLAPDRRMLFYALGLSALTSLLCGLSPARRATRLEVFPTLKDDAPRMMKQRLRQMLVIGQVTISCLLLLWGGLFSRSLLNAHRVNPGFDPSGVLLANFVLEDAGIHDDRAAAFVDELQSRVRALPGVQSAGMATIVPLSLTGREEYDVRPDTDGKDAPGRRVMAIRVTPGWFDALRIPVIAGRDLTPSDRTGAPRVALVNETMARRFWNGQAVGHRVDDVEIVGVVRDSKYWTLGEAIKPTIYTALVQKPLSEVNLHVRTSDLTGTTVAIRREVARMAPDLFVEVKPMTAAVGVAIVPAQVGAALTAACGVLAALLAMMGIYGLVALSVAQRTREIGIRKAIGARTTDIVRVVVGGSIGPVAIGYALGALFGSLGAFALGGFIVGVSPIDPITIVVTGAVVLATAVAASAIPALRASRVDPLVALRTE
jgi:putative ABC transport system permease protein